MLKIIIVGIVGKKPELTQKNGNSYCEIEISIDKKEEKASHTLIAEGKRAEIACKYLDKGSRIYAEGELIGKTLIESTEIKFLGRNQD